MFTPKDRDLERGWPGRIDGDRVIQLAAQTLQSFFTGGGTAREHAEYPLDEVDLLAPVLHPPSVRDFYAFEQHVRPRARCAASRCRPSGTSSRSSTSRTRPRSTAPRTRSRIRTGTEELDYELEVAAVIGADGAIGGFTVMNDWSARDLQRRRDEGRPRPGEGQGLRDARSARSS